jgi:hypothetical protein
MSTTTTPTLSMYHAVREAIDSFQFHAEELAVLLRYQQLANNVLHPDGLQQRVDFEARQLFAQVRLARTLIDTIENADGRLGEDIATAQSWTDAAKTEAGE